MARSGIARLLVGRRMPVHHISENRSIRVTGHGAHSHGLSFEGEIRTGALNKDCVPLNVALAAESATCTHYPADLVVCRAGTVPHTENAELAVIPARGGLIVDPALANGVDGVLATGCNAFFPTARTGYHAWQKTVENATVHGREAARSIMGQDDDYIQTPWFQALEPVSARRSPDAEKLATNR